MSVEKCTCGTSAVCTLHQWPVWTWSIIIAVALLSGCALQEQRQLLLAPEALNAPATRTAFADSYARTLVAAQSDSTQVPRYVDAGIALVTRNCVDWLTRRDLASRGVVASDRNIGVFAGLLTALFGVFGASAEAVAVLGAGVAAAHGFGANLQADVLGAPSPYQAQALVLGLLGQCTDKLAEEAEAITFAKAYAGLEACNRTCSAGAATEAANHALSSTPIVVERSGAMWAR